MLSLYCKVKALLSSLRTQQGQPALEYIAIAVAVTVGIVVALEAFGGDVSGRIEDLYDEIFG